MRSIITFIKYTKSQKCGQTNNLKALARKPWLILAIVFRTFSVHPFQSLGYLRK